MLRPLFRPYLALLLLLCLVRTLLPEAWVLALHRHAHTTEKLAATRRPTTGQEALSPRHTHCHAEQFYNVPFVPAVPVRVPHPPVPARYQALAVPTPPAALATLLRRTALRGPPQA